MKLLKSVKLLLVASFFIGVAQIKAQGQAKSPNVDVSKSQTQSGPRAVQATPKPESTVINEDDPYQGRKQEFLNQLIIDKLPDDFPKYEKGSGIKAYNNIVDAYYRQHPAILKDGPRKKMGL